jgi:hypothetical protein
MSRRVVHQNAAYVSARSLLHLFSNALLLISKAPIFVQLYWFHSTFMEASDLRQHMSVSKQCFGVLFSTLGILRTSNSFEDSHFVRINHVQSYR